MKTRMKFWFIFKLCMGKLFTQQQNRVNVEVSEEYHSVTVFILIHDYFFHFGITIHPVPHDKVI